MLRLSLALALLTAPAFVGAQEGHAHQPGAHGAPKLGTVRFPNSGARAAQAPFLRGIALLHSFEYEDAAAAFREAERADRDFALPYWFEALTHSHVLWGEDDPAGGRAVLARLGPTPAARLGRARTSQERSFGAAIEAFFADTSLAARATAFADSMRALAERSPDDQEAAAFASIALQMAANYVPVDRRRPLRDGAVTYAERVFRRNPDHPGAAHYLIHISDLDDGFTTRALPAARAYAKIAPDADHALHMPSHVFLKLGMWDELVASNERAWAANRAWLRRNGRSGADASFHALQWLQYGYLQQGRLRQARALLDTARAVLAGTKLEDALHVDPRFAPAFMEFAYAMESGRWRDVAIAGPVDAVAAASPSAAREASFLARSRYHRAAAAAMRGDSTFVAQARAPTGDATTSAPPSNPMATVFAVGLQALRDAARGDTAAMIERLRRAGDTEDRIVQVGPPIYLSAHEQLGAALLAGGRATDAAAAYERALAHTPNRSAALLGLARARAAAGDVAGAADAYRRLLANWKRADADLPALAEVRRGAARAGVTQSGRVADPPGGAGYAYVWATFVDTATADTTVRPRGRGVGLVTIDLRAASPTHGRVVGAVLADSGGRAAHHTEHALAEDGLFFANDFGAGRTHRFDLRRAGAPRLLGSFTTAGPYANPHSFVRLANGNMLATYQVKVDGGAPGGLVELRRDGTPVRWSGAAAPGVDTTLIEPYSVEVIPALDRVVTTSTSMKRDSVGAHVQVWRLSDLKLLHTLRMPVPTSHAAHEHVAGVSDSVHHLFPGEPRLLADGKTVMLGTFTCGVYRVVDAERTPRLELSYAFPGENCAVPVRVGHWWVQTVPALHALVTLDVSDPAHPREVSRLAFGDRVQPHWLAVNASGRRFVMNTGSPSEPRLFFATLDPATGALARDTSLAPVDLSRIDVPGLGFVRAVPHGTVFGPAHR